MLGFFFLPSANEKFASELKLQILKKVMQDSECEGHVIQNMHPDMEF